MMADVSANSRVFGLANSRLFSHVWFVAATELSVTCLSIRLETATAAFRKIMELLGGGVTQDWPQMVHAELLGTASKI